MASDESRSFMKSSEFWVSVIACLALSVPMLWVAFFSAGAGPDYHWGRILFPYAAIAMHIDGGIFFVALLGQMPIYGVVFAISRQRNRARYGVIALLAHLIAVAICFLPWFEREL